MRWRGRLKRIAVVALTAFLILLAAQTAWARLGVGINVGKIEVNEPLLSGGIYSVAKMSVINTGTEIADYGLGVSYMEKQAEKRPPKNWFAFSPSRFRLKPGAARTVDVSLIIPINANEGDYFALVEAHPIIEKKGVTIGIAAAAKAFFTVKSSSLLWSIINRLLTWFTTNAPYSYVGTALIVAAAVVLMLRRFFKFSLRIERKGE